MHSPLTRPTLRILHSSLTAATAATAASATTAGNATARVELSRYTHTYLLALTHACLAPTQPLYLPGLARLLLAGATSDPPSHQAHPVALAHHLPPLAHIVSPRAKRLAPAPIPVNLLEAMDKPQLALATLAAYGAALVGSSRPASHAFLAEVLDIDILSCLFRALRDCTRPELEPHAALLVRVLAVVIRAATLDVTSLSALCNALPFNAFLQLAAAPDLPPAISVELWQLLCVLLYRATPLDPALLSSFYNLGGDDALATAIIGLETRDTAAVNALITGARLLCFLSPSLAATPASTPSSSPAGADDSLSLLTSPLADSVFSPAFKRACTIVSTSPISTLLDVFVSASRVETKLDVLRSLELLWVDNPTNYALLGALAPFDTFLQYSTFHKLHLELQYAILSALTRLVLSSGLPLRNELAHLVALLAPDTPDISPPSALILAHHIRYMLHHAPPAINLRRRLRAAGMVDLLVALTAALDSPSSRPRPLLAIKDSYQHAFISMLLTSFEDLVASPNHSDFLAPLPTATPTPTAILTLAARRLPASSYYPITRNLLGLSSSYASSTASTYRTRADVHYGVCASLLALVDIFLSTKPATAQPLRAAFVAAAGLPKLYRVVADARLRPHALGILATLGSEDSAQDWRIVPDLIAVVRAVHPRNVARPTALSLQHDVLRVLASILCANPAAKIPFQTGDGFRWSIGVLDTLAKAYPTPDTLPVAPRKLFDFVRTLLELNAIAIHNSRDNAEYFATSITFDALVNVLSSSRLFLASDFTLVLFELVIELGLAGTWPPSSCSAHSLIAFRSLPQRLRLRGLQLAIAVAEPSAATPPAAAPTPLARSLFPDSQRPPTPDLDSDSDSFVTPASSPPASPPASPPDSPHISSPRSIFPPRAAAPDADFLLPPKLRARERHPPSPVPLFSVSSPPDSPLYRLHNSTAPFSASFRALARPPCPRTQPASRAILRSPQQRLSGSIRSSSSLSLLEDLPHAQADIVSEVSSELELTLADPTCRTLFADYLATTRSLNELRFHDAVQALSAKRAASAPDGSLATAALGLVATYVDDSHSSSPSDADDAPLYLAPELADTIRAAADALARSLSRASSPTSPLRSPDSTSASPFPPAPAAVAAMSDMATSDVFDLDLDAELLARVAPSSPAAAAPPTHDASPVTSPTRLRAPALLSPLLNALDAAADAIFVQLAYTHRFFLRQLGREELYLFELAHCRECSRDMAVVLPAAFTAVVRLAASAVALDLGLGNQIAYHVLHLVTFLIGAFPANVYALGEADLLGTVLAEFGGILIDANSPLQPLVLDLVVALAAFRCTVVNLQEFMVLLHPRFDPPHNVYEALLYLSALPPRLDHAAFFPHAANATPRPLPIDPLIAANPLLPSHGVALRSLATTSWPPSRGFTLSIWFQPDGPSPHAFDIGRISLDTSATPTPRAQTPPPEPAAHPRIPTSLPDSFRRLHSVTPDSSPLADTLDDLPSPSSASGTDSPEMLVRTSSGSYPIPIRVGRSRPLPEPVDRGAPAVPPRASSATPPPSASSSAAAPRRVLVNLGPLTPYAPHHLIICHVRASKGSPLGNLLVYLDGKLVARQFSTFLPPPVRGHILGDMHPLIPASPALAASAPASPTPWLLGNMNLLKNVALDAAEALMLYAQGSGPCSSLIGVATVSLRSFEFAAPEWLDYAATHDLLGPGERLRVRALLRALCPEQSGFETRQLLFPASTGSRQDARSESVFRRPFSLASSFASSLAATLASSPSTAFDAPRTVRMLDDDIDDAFLGLEPGAPLPPDALPTLEGLRSSIIFVLNVGRGVVTHGAAVSGSSGSGSKDAAFAGSVSGAGPSAAASSSSAAPVALYPTATWMGGSISHVSENVRDNLYACGGMDSVLYMAALSVSGPPELQHLVLALFPPLIGPAYSPNAHRMSALGGYELLGYMLRAPDYTLDITTAMIMFELSGLRKLHLALRPHPITLRPAHLLEHNIEPISGSSFDFVYGGGVLANVDAALATLLDWRVWKRAPPRVQTFVWESFVTLLAPGSATPETASGRARLRHCRTNLQLLRAIGLFERLLVMIQLDPEFPEGHMPYIIQLLRALVSSPPRSYELQLLIQFLVRTHPVSRASQQRVAVPRPVSSSSLLDFELLSRSFNANHDSSFAADSTVDGASTSVSSSSVELPSVRLALLYFLVEIVTTLPDPALVELATDSLSALVLVQLAQHPCSYTRVCLLQIIDRYLGVPSLAAAFVASAGFDLLGSQLATHPATRLVVDALFAVMQGSTEPANVSRQPGQSSESGADASCSRALPHPHCVRTLLRVAGNCWDDTVLRHATIRRLHYSVFEASLANKEALVAAGLVRELVALLATALAEDVVDTVFEGDIIVFLAAIAVYGCGLKSGDNELVLSVVTGLGTLSGVSALKIRQVQQRTLHMALAAYHETWAQHDLGSRSTLATLAALARCIVDSVVAYSPESPGVHSQTVEPEPDTARHVEAHSIEFDLVVFVVNLLVDLRPHARAASSATARALDDALASLLLWVFQRFHAHALDESAEEMRIGLQAALEAAEVARSRTESTSSAPPTAAETAILTLRPELTVEAASATKSRDPFATSSAASAEMIEEARASSASSSRATSPFGTLISEEFSESSQTFQHAVALAEALARQVPSAVVAAFAAEKAFLIRFVLYTQPMLRRVGVASAVERHWLAIAEHHFSTLGLIIKCDISADLELSTPAGVRALQALLHTVEGIRRPSDVFLQATMRQARIAEADAAAVRDAAAAAYTANLAAATAECAADESAASRTWAAACNAFLTSQVELNKPVMGMVQHLAEQDYAARKRWRGLCQDLTHERGPWHVTDDEVRVWLGESDSDDGGQDSRSKADPHGVAATPGRESQASASVRRARARATSERFASGRHVVYALNPTESAARLRVRLQPIPPPLMFVDWLSAPVAEEEADKRSGSMLALADGERLQHLFRCVRITPARKVDGELLVGSSSGYFIPDKHQGDDSAGGASVAPLGSGLGNSHLAQLFEVALVVENLEFEYVDVKEVHKRRYLLKNCALEIFLLTGTTMLFAFESERIRDEAYKAFLKSELPNRIDYESSMSGSLIRKSVLDKWRSGKVSNFDYLMHLNTLAGRSFNDLTQYPVFPFVLAQYGAAELDLSDPASFRDFAAPMGAQDPGRLAKFEAKFEALQQMHAEAPDDAPEPYYYGSHYSNIGSVLHFLVRVEPFTQFFIQFQGGCFDLPDRTFHSVAHTWRLSSSISTSDVKELIPEFYYFPEALINLNACNFGRKQDGTPVDSVELPPWARGSARTFVRRMREALESEYVSDHLHEWIDLIFGFKQRGEAALVAKNVFYPLTYEGAVDIDAIDDEIQRVATITQISNYGQTPTQLFSKPHPARSSSWRSSGWLFADHVFLPDVVLGATVVRGLAARVAVGMIAPQPGAPSAAPVVMGASRVAIPPQLSKMVSYGHWDSTFRLTAIESGRQLAVVPPLYAGDEIVVAIAPELGERYSASNPGLVVTGSSSGVVRVWTLTQVSDKACDMVEAGVLVGHEGAVLSMAASVDFGVIVSGSMDGSVIVWDLNTLRYVMSMDVPGYARALAVSKTNADVAVASSGSGEALSLYTINGAQVARVKPHAAITCVDFTSGCEGEVVNVVVGGTLDGSVLMWSTEDLSLVRSLTATPHMAPITALAIVGAGLKVYTGDADGVVVMWQAVKGKAAADAVAESAAFVHPDSEAAAVADAVSAVL
ncbi:WD repeat and FYVE domain-containing protein 3 [Thecamonas trahens ATCC 50062]|uniref:WD repeat and FYVE domain-containing protein 3 n=1 Tax=Thecamonas trahens ATCC 50062 TaxID=461836 RepID=A0A0L0DDY4_THETB|nr:WD repeat and FYVE domain-containing protein 3 [Thecamonas trahens ATCC 50062]KNC49528.1 WD repeat and FYVE domain-containing protein 3 [Thecamonas trahens ATCC 50062]|eukprot:XP_013757643.1 WD repeat and FYVE domain-containing protein 3 [Thecamonas trahens ATCC 50062]